MDIDLARIEQAAATIDPVFLNTPQYVDDRLSEALRRTVTVKLETANPIRSFKGRGADFLLRHLEPRGKVVCASAGNFGQAMAYCGRSHGIPVEVFVAASINPDKRARMEALGATVTVAGPDGASARAAAEDYASRNPGVRCLQDGREVRVAEGAGTIGRELAAIDDLEAVVVPVGDGALINGIGTWFKAKRPNVRVIGVNAKGAASMRESLRAGRAVSVPEVDTFADGISIQTPFDVAVRRAREVVDEILLVDDEQIGAAMTLAARTLGVLLEPAAAAGLAAIAAGDVAQRRVATVLTGANPRPEQVRALAAELAR
ncbi:threonine ammonia-lyase [Stackebrandtia nassauensis]|uniref:Pyridoxal-5'-phosphate-dependent protein beta subunit n=1 Tax=Stackebrandtia nassauensis (strain DSM 44728 / CIP 108903 / NRRL B-16338 / NBRC 102104 / LLR-40K-21) TaxID=446470 RepID=D3PVR5_STANL|nr:pyridoxal-phosphate dependent enzyme [Stackebrandtia nassauensis]ADD43179.1 Pyridoxal-5'-phosphate-dependent protein beta subunit [Stackebrandtia nassauensis DSM 44728]